MNSKFVPYHSVMELNWINRNRRNKKRKRNRRWHGRLRRADARAERIAHEKWLESCAKECCCEPPNPCPCDSVLCGSPCELAGREPYFDEEDDA